jgi:hypothetical protein
VFRCPIAKGKKTIEEITAIGKTPVTFLQEYCVNVIKIPPTYENEIQGSCFFSIVTQSQNHTITLTLSLSLTLTSL